MKSADNNKHGGWTGRAVEGISMGQPELGRQHLRKSMKVQRKQVRWMPGSTGAWNLQATARTPLSGGE